ncbi:HAMP domain-containing sensor histidine kinase [Pseudomonas atacamensis]|uniref:HAMP domain-containing sensor histidine kinase n=1 Tax=Pseudomonas atacamensis TaxID=2565368 RepID=UPI0030CDC0C9
MRLPDFIEANLETILHAWESFARDVDTAQELSITGLRNHAEQILKAVAVDMRLPQTESQEIRKSKGLAPASIEETAAQAHAVLRLIDGFSMDQMVSEYRALRSSVLRIWLVGEEISTSSQIADMVRFNEAIDQALVESIAAYGKAVETTRRMVLGVLGHDLRAPLTATLMGADLLRKSPNLTDREKDIATQVGTSARRANRMVNDLVDLARCNLGTGIPVAKRPSELNLICRTAINELSAGEPGAVIEFNDTAQVVGQFDPERIAQVFTNLIGNAIRHGDLHQPIQVALVAENGTMTFEVRNAGKPIPAVVIPTLFDPGRRYSGYTEVGSKSPQGLGLGLFIAAEIVASHGGKIRVSSSETNGTCFSVTIPL